MQRPEPQTFLKYPWIDADFPGNHSDVLRVAELRGGSGTPKLLAFLTFVPHLLFDSAAVDGQRQF